MSREIELFVDHPSLNYKEESVIETILLAIETIGDAFPKGDLSVALLSDRKVAELHGEFLDDPSETDVITFPGDEEMDFAGEICVSVDRATEVCAEHQTTISEEITLYIVHGLLHLAGYKDKTDSQVIEMREGERKVMLELKAQGKIPDFS